MHLRHTVFLIVNRAKNAKTCMNTDEQVKIALSEGVKSVWCNPKDPTTMIKELLRLGNPRDTPHPRPAECAP